MHVFSTWAKVESFVNWPNASFAQGNTEHCYVHPAKLLVNPTIL